MDRVPRRALALFLVVPLATGGCSFMAVRRPPEQMADPARPGSPCQVASAPPVVDAVLALLGGVGMARAAATDSPALVTAGLLTAVFAASSAYGFHQGGRCRAMEALHERCLQGDGAACRALDPGANPGVPALVPLLCATDAGCAAGQRCVDSTCRPAPPTAAPGP